MLDKEVSVDEYADMKILCVDDESGMLKALQRLFHRKSYQVLTAQNAKDALLLLDKHPINLIISDMRMPEVNGAELLEQVAHFHPEIHRIILSGYADFESTVAAINLGKIHNFINKPWNNDELVSVVEEGLARIKLKQENSRLRALVEQQNRQLKAWNNELEEKINLRTKQIRNALKINERNIKASERMLFNFIYINSNLNGQFSRNVASLAGRLAEKLTLEEKDINTIRLAGGLIELGLLGLTPTLSSTPFSLLNYAQKKEFNSQGIIAEQILAPAQHLKSVSDILTHQYQSINSLSLPNNIIMAIKIIVIARDYWRYANGKILPGILTHGQIKNEMNKGKNSLYHEEILSILFSNPELINDTQETGLTSRQLKPGMLLKHNLYTANHLLVLAEGHEFSQVSIDRLIAYERNKKQVFSIVIEISINKNETPKL